MVLERTLDDAGVDIEEIIAGHARLACNAGGHGDEIAAVEGGVQVLLVHALVGDELGLCISAQRISISARDERHLRGGAGRLHSPQTTIATGG